MGFANFDLRRDALKAGQIIHHESNAPAVLNAKLARQPPANPDVTEVIDDAAKDIATNDYAAPRASTAALARR